MHTEPQNTERWYPFDELESGAALRSLRDEHRRPQSQDCALQVVFAGSPFPQHFSQSLFLAGPTPRAPHVKSWRPEALRLLRESGYRGVVFVPEFEGSVRPDYDDQVEWETQAMRRSDAIVFWIPAEKEDMPALATRTEFGEHLASGKMTLGIPPSAWKGRYLAKKAAEYGIPVHHDLRATLETALESIAGGAPRRGPETLIPPAVWRLESFKHWYGALEAQCSELQDVRRVVRLAGSAGQAATIVIQTVVRSGEGAERELIFLAKCGE